MIAIKISMGNGLVAWCSCFSPKWDNEGKSIQTGHQRGMECLLLLNLSSKALLHPDGDSEGNMKTSLAWPLVKIHPWLYQSGTCAIYYDLVWTVIIPFCKVISYIAVRVFFDIVLVFRSIALSCECIMHMSAIKGILNNIMSSKQLVRERSHLHMVSSCVSSGFCPSVMLCARRMKSRHRKWNGVGKSKNIYIVNDYVE